MTIIIIITITTLISSLMEGTNHIVCKGLAADPMLHPENWQLHLQPQRHVYPSKKHHDTAWYCHPS
jgi:hypothetical protein